MRGPLVQETQTWPWPYHPLGRGGGTAASGRGQKHLGAYRRQGSCLGERGGCSREVLEIKERMAQAQPHGGVAGVHVLGPPGAPKGREEPHGSGIKGNAVLGREPAKRVEWVDPSVPDETEAGAMHHSHRSRGTGGTLAEPEGY